MTDPHPAPIPGTTLLALAGPRAGGKSTLLQLAIREGIPLFGRENQEKFLSLSGRKLGYRRATAARDAARNSAWISVRHLAEINAEAVLPPILAVHIDLMTLCGFDDRPFTSLASASENTAHMLAYPGLEMFGRYETVAISTLQTPWPVALRRHHRRNLRGKGTISSSTQRLYDPAESERQTYEAIYAAWEAVLRVIPWTVSLTARYGADGESLTLERNPPNANS
jgi:hypothetical protein